MKLAPVLSLIAILAATGPAHAQSPAPKKEISACVVREEKPLLAHYIIYARGEEHLAFDGPELMTRDEAAARQVLLQDYARTKYGEGSRIVYGVVDKPDSCSFLYRDKSGKKFSLAQGSSTYTDRRRGDLVRFNDGVPSSPTLCHADKPGRYTRVFGLQAEAACTAAKQCIAEDAVKRSLGKVDAYTCDCESVAGAMSSCAANATSTSKDVPFGVRG